MASPANLLGLWRLTLYCEPAYMNLQQMASAPPSGRTRLRLPEASRWGRPSRALNFSQDVGAAVKSNLGNNGGTWTEPVKYSPVYVCKFHLFESGGLQAAARWLTAVICQQPNCWEEVYYRANCTPTQTRSSQHQDSLRAANEHETQYL